MDDHFFLEKSNDRYAICTWIPSENTQILRVKFYSR